MLMCHVSVDIPDEVLEQMKVKEEEMVAYARKAVALHLFKDNVELGHCAKVAGMDMEDFMQGLGEFAGFVFE